jgi:hypothetical protein
MEKLRVDWRCGSSGRVPALQGRSPEFKAHFQQKKKREKVRKKETEGTRLVQSQSQIKKIIVKIKVL